MFPLAGGLMLDAENPGTATATAEPPVPPAPPTTATGAPGPARPRRRWLAWTIGVLAAVIAIGALVGVVVWALGRGGHSADFSAYRAPFESAMKKAGVSAEFPSAPVDLESVSASGSHTFSATFTAEEVSALVNVFRFASDVEGTSIAVSGAKVALPGNGAVRLSANVQLNGSAYSGSVEGPLEFESGRLTSSGATKASVEGISVGGDKAREATAVLIEYLNRYLEAAPGLMVTSARVTPEGFAVEGTAPDSLSGLSKP